MRSLAGVYHLLHQLGYSPTCARVCDTLGATAPMTTTKDWKKQPWPPGAPQYSIPNS